MIQLFNELRKHGKLAAKRHPMYDKNKFGKYMMYIAAFFWIGYLIFFGITFAFALETENMEPYHLMNGGLIFVMTLDFLLRFAFQKTPTQEVKPYLLLPVKRNRLIDFLLIRSGLSGFNFIWLFLFVPFAIITVTRYYGIAGIITYCLGIWLLMVFNNYWYLLCRTLMSERIWWILLPLAVYGGLAAAIFIPETSFVTDFFVDLGEFYIEGNILIFLATIGLIVAMWLANRIIMSELIYQELNKVEDTKVNASEYKFFERYGEIGEYMRLELKMMLRNKTCKHSLRMIMIVVIAFSCLLGFTEHYDQTGMKNFITVYNFAVFGIMFLINIMGYEGNYMDGLMSRKESIYNLLRAKYILYCIAILIPLILMSPAIIMGKVSFLTAISLAVFTIGFIYFGLFQLAVYNNKSTPLNAKITGRQNSGTGLQNLISGVTLGAPLILLVVLKLIFGETGASWVLLIIGLSFVATSKWWIMNVYKRFMKRRYQNMQDFRSSRER